MKVRHGVIFTSNSKKAHELIDVPIEHKKVFYGPKVNEFPLFVPTECQSVEEFFDSNGDFVNAFRKSSINNEEVYFIL